jgi:hypothetical protein
MCSRAGGTPRGAHNRIGGTAEPELLADITMLRSSSTPLRIIVDGSPQTPRVALEPLTLARSAFPGAADAVIEASQNAALRTAEAVFSLTRG